MDAEPTANRRRGALHALVRSLPPAKQKSVHPANAARMAAAPRTGVVISLRRKDQRQPQRRLSHEALAARLAFRDGHWDGLVPPSLFSATVVGKSSPRQRHQTGPGAAWPCEIRGMSVQTCAPESQVRTRLPRREMDLTFRFLVGSPGNAKRHQALQIAIPHV